MEESSLEWVVRKKWNLIAAAGFIALGFYAISVFGGNLVRSREEEKALNNDAITFLWMQGESSHYIMDMSENEEKRFRMAIEERYPGLAGKIELTPGGDGLYKISLPGSIYPVTHYFREIASDAGLQEMTIPFSRKTE
ncbi:MAG: hypothetical protein KJ709_05010 [Nanoarchaeota archaeon]|nr:hypothetical protein [Nanoarchaeota archaeon]